MHIKPLTAEHFKSVKDIFGESFYKDGMNNTDLCYYWRKRKSDSLGIFTPEGDLLGFSIIIQPAGTPNNRYLAYFAVHSDYRGGSLGTDLMAATLVRRKGAGGALHLMPLNGKVRAWYLKRGFKNTFGGYMNYHSYGTRSKRGL